MKTIITISTAALMAFSVPAFAGGHGAGSDNASTTGSAKGKGLSGGLIGSGVAGDVSVGATNPSAGKGAGAASIAPTVSGETVRGNSGWGNVTGTSGKD